MKFTRVTPKPYLLIMYDDLDDNVKDMLLNDACTDSIGEYIPVNIPNSRDKLSLWQAIILSNISMMDRENIFNKHLEIRIQM